MYLYHTMQSFKFKSSLWRHCKPYQILSPPCKVSNPTLQRYSCTWCYCKPYQIVSPPCRVSTPTHVHGVPANLTRLYLHHALFQILLMFMALLQTLLDCIPTIMPSFKSTYVHIVSANFKDFITTCKVPNLVSCIAHGVYCRPNLCLSAMQFQILHKQHTWAQFHRAAEHTNSC